MLDRLFKQLIALYVYLRSVPFFVLKKRGETKVETRELSVGEKEVILKLIKDGKFKYNNMKCPEKERDH